MYSALSQLNHEQYQQIEELAQRCKEKEGGAPLLYSNLLLQSRNQESNWLFEDAQRCLGLASVYYFYDKACEITLMIDPSYRRQGHAKQLLARLMPQLQQRGMETLIFTMATQSPHSPWLQKKGFEYRTSEYRMQRDGYDPKLTGAHQLKITAAQPNDIEFLCQIDEQCFGVRPEMAERFSALIYDTNYSILIARLNNMAIGKAHIHWQNNAALFSDIAILPAFQGQGFGSELLAFLIETSLKEGFNRQVLDVETQNAHALKIYQQYGFKSYDSHEYWQIELKQLQSLLKP